METPILFSPLKLRGLTLPNRIVISPMCQYSAIEGCATDWHAIHLGHLAFSGAGLLVIEATGVEPRGRISAGCLGLYNDETEAALATVLDRIRPYANMPIGIQLSHAGRKASINVPNSGVRGTVPLSDGGWETIGPSSQAFADDWRAPREMTEGDMEVVIESFAQATRRCARLGMDMIEIHSAHGYLLSAFLSPIANRRTDAFGGSLENRMKFPLAVAMAVRKNWPNDRPLGVRLNGTDWLDGGIKLDEAQTYAAALADIGCDYVDVSSGGNGHAKIQLSAGYQVPFAESVKDGLDIPVMAVGLIRDPQYAEKILLEGRADMIGVGRVMLYDPRWPLHAAETLGAVPRYPWQYERGARREVVPNYDTLPDYEQANR